MEPPLKNTIYDGVFFQDNQKNILNFEPQVFRNLGVTFLGVQKHFFTYFWLAHLILFEHAT